MNALPTGPGGFEDPARLERYFADMERWNFDVAYNAYYAGAYEEVTQTHRKAYKAFAAEAKRRGYPACVQLQSTLCKPHGFGIEEAQYYLDNTPDLSHGWPSEGCFFASFASEKWKAYLLHLTDYFVNECGFEWVVYEEPMYRVDIPGTKDRFHELFRAQYPHLAYPARHEESEAYLRVQRLKQDLLIRFYDDLMTGAKKLGASKAGVMPWFFIPTIENTPSETLHTACPTGRIIALDSLDFVVVRMQPDNIYAGVMRIGDPDGDFPEEYYPEVLAHLIGKPAIAVNNPINEHVPEQPTTMIPLEFFQRYTLSCFAGGPHGMTRHWYGHAYDPEKEHMEFLAATNRYINRLGSPDDEVAFVFSHLGAIHARPNHYEEVWKRYWAFAREWMIRRGLPMQTFYAETLDWCLQNNPGTRLLIFDPAFPLEEPQVESVRRWLAEDEKRAIVLFGTHGFSADPARPGMLPIEEAAPELLRLTRSRPRQALRIEKPLSLLDPPPVDRILRDLLPKLGVRPRAVTGERGIFWNRTRWGFVPISNCTTKPARARIEPGDALVWDVVNRRWEESREIELAPLSFRLFRFVPTKSPLLDVDGMLYIRSIAEEDGTAVVEVLARGPVSLRTRSCPTGVLLDGETTSLRCWEDGSSWKLEVDCPAGDHRIEIKMGG